MCVSRTDTTVEIGTPDLPMRAGQTQKPVPIGPNRTDASIGEIIPDLGTMTGYTASPTPVHAIWTDTTTTCTVPDLLRIASGHTLVSVPTVAN